MVRGQKILTLMVWGQKILIFNGLGTENIDFVVRGQKILIFSGPGTENIDL